MSKRTTKRMTFRRVSVLMVPLILAIAVLAAFAESKAGAAKTTPYRSPYAVAYSPDGKLLAVSDHTAKTVALIDTASGKVTHQVPLNGQPAGLAWSPDGAKVFVAECWAGTIAQIDAKTAKLERRLTVGPQPLAVAVAKKRNLLLATNRATNTVSVIDLGTGKQRARVPVVREPDALALTPDESIALVSNLLPAGASTDPTTSASVSLIDLDQLKCLTDIRLPAGSTVVRGIVVSPDGRWSYVVHTVGRFNIPTTQLERGWVNTNALSILDMGSKKLLTTVLLDHPSEGSADPWGLAISSDGNTLYVSISGIHRIAKIDVGGLHKLIAGDFTGHPTLSKPDPRNPGPMSIWLQIKKDPTQLEQLVNELAALHAVDLIVNIPIEGKGPRGISLSPDGKRLAAAVYFSGTVALVDTATCRPAGTISLGPSPEADLVRRGEIIFHDADYCFQHWLSCATCHPDGRVDGLNWDLLNDGMGNPKNTKSLLLSHKTPPTMALGVRDNMEVAAVAGFRHILFRQPEPADVEATQAYIRSLEPGVSPHRQPDGSLSVKALRGKAIFESPQTLCASCHPPGLFTDLKLSDVGTRHELDRTGIFDTPTLIELWRSAPYLHDGSAATLRDVLTTFNKNDKHGITSKLSKDQLDDLIEYLLSL